MKYALNKLSKDELLCMAAQKEEELRLIYSAIYQWLPQPETKKPLFTDLEETDRLSVCGSISAHWANSIRGTTVEQREEIDCNRLAAEFFRKYGKKYESLIISLHDVTMQFHKLKMRNVRKR